MTQFMPFSYQRRRALQRYLSTGLTPRTAKVFLEIEDRELAWAIPFGKSGLWAAVASRLDKAPLGFKMTSCYLTGERDNFERYAVAGVSLVDFIPREFM